MKRGYFHRGSFLTRLLEQGRRAAVLVLLSSAMVAQQAPSNRTEVQRAAMQKLAFLAGRWAGAVTVVRGPGEALHLTQSENVQYKLDGLVLVIEGKSSTRKGETPFQALAMVSFDEATHTYRIRAYHDGHYVDDPLSLQNAGFTWGFAAGPARIVNTMHLTPKGEWQEVSEVRVGSYPPQRSVEMLLQRQL